MLKKDCGEGRVGPGPVLAVGSGPEMVVGS